MEKVSICGIGVSNVNLDEAVLEFKRLYNGGTSSQIVTPNAEIMQSCLEDEKLKNIINSAAMVIPDGVGVVLASKILKTSPLEKVAGVDLAYAVLPQIEADGKRLFLLGAKQETLELAAEKIRQMCPKINICGTQNGYFKDDETVVGKINESSADVVFVCLGSPRQEFWIYENKDRCCAKVMIGLGGTFDVIAGTVKRAPKIFIKLGMEWFYRLLKEPKRFFRMLKLPKFVLSVLRYKFFNKTKQQNEKGRLN